MQFVTLQQVKDQLGETTSARDAYLTQLADGIETEICVWLRAATLEAITATIPAELQDQAEAILKQAVLLNVRAREKDGAYNIWQNGNPTKQLLYPYRLPAVAVEADE